MTLQQITRRLHLSETTFLLPPTTPDADYLVRIFTLDREMPSAGHPTLGSCHAWLAAGGTPKDPRRIIQESGVGLAGIDRVPARVAGRGGGHALKSADAVLALAPAHHHATRLDVGLVGPCPPVSEAAWELRALFTDPRGVILEDPATGSLNASVAQWLLGAGSATAPYVASQGTCLGRKGRVRVDQDGDGRIWIGSATRTLFSGETAF